MSAWIFLVIAGCLEVGFTTCMKLSDGFTRLPYTLAFLAFAIGSFVMLNRAVAEVPMGTAYAIWTGIGAAGTVIVGIWAFGEPSSAARVLLLCTLVGSIIGLKLVG